MRMLVLSLASLSGLRIQCCCVIGHRCDSDLTLLWLCCRLAAAAPNWPVSWELPYATIVALKIKAKKKKKSGPDGKFHYNPYKHSRWLINVLAYVVWQIHCQKTYRKFSDSMVMSKWTHFLDHVSEWQGETILSWDQTGQTPWLCFVLLVWPWLRNLMSPNFCMSRAPILLLQDHKGPGSSDCVHSTVCILAFTWS